MLRKALLVCCLILLGFTETRCNEQETGNEDSSQNEPAGKTPTLVLSSPSECARECKVDEPPKTCYYRFRLEIYPILSRACDYCTPNSTDVIQSNCQCITADGVERTTLTVNRMLPGPSIQVCLGDKIVVDVENNMPGMETSIHWRGMRQRGSQYYDGVPFLTQCPIPKGSIFRYQFSAETEGTHFWSSKSGLQAAEGIRGSLIVRVPPNRDPNSFLYNYDLPEHVVFLSDWLTTQATIQFPGTSKMNIGLIPNSVLINGKGQYKNPLTGNVTSSPSAVFTIKQGLSYRFRIINSFATVCLAELTIERHSMTVIAVDGSPILPRVVNSIISSPGERYDVVLNATKDPGAYWIQVRIFGTYIDDKVEQTAVLRYEGTADEPKSEQPTYDEGLSLGVVLNPLGDNCTTECGYSLSISDLKTARPVDKKILQEPDLKLYIPATFIGYPLETLFEPNTYYPFLVTPTQRHIIGVLNDVSFKYPSSPPLSQSKDLTQNWFCNALDPPRACRIACRCTSIYDIPLGSVVEVVIIDKRAQSRFRIPFHIHGYSVSLIGSGYLPDLNVTQITAESIRDYDSKHPLHRNFDSPVSRDTFVVPTAGYTIIRFLADNPGYWLLRGQVPFHDAIGLEVVFHVGETSDLPPVPPGFPVCKNFMPPFKAP